MDYLKFFDVKKYITFYTPIKIENARGVNFYTGVLGSLNEQYDKELIRSIYTHDDFLVIRLQQ